MNTRTQTQKIKPKNMNSKLNPLNQPSFTLNQINNAIKFEKTTKTNAERSMLKINKFFSFFPKDSWPKS